jgi:hypothetical protein
MDEQGAVADDPDDRYRHSMAGPVEKQRSNEEVSLITNAHAIRESQE